MSLAVFSSIEMIGTAQDFPCSPEIIYRQFA